MLTKNPKQKFTKKSCKKIQFSQRLGTLEKGEKLSQQFTKKKSKENSTIEQLAAEKDVTSRKLWQKVKGMAGWINSLSPTKFATENGLIFKPLEMANLLNDYFFNKVNNICLELVNNNNCDPLSLLKSNMNKWIHKEKYKKFELTKVKPKQVRKLF